MQEEPITMTGDEDIDNAVIALLDAITASERRAAEEAKRRQEARRALSCSFCGKRPSEVTHMVAGPDVRICGDCVAFYADSIAQGHCRTGFDPA